jgi:Zn-dependent protease with chaperone function
VVFINPTRDVVFNSPLSTGKCPMMMMITLARCGVLAAWLTTMALPPLALGSEAPTDAPAAENPWAEPTYEKRVYYIGQYLLKKNHINDLIAFYVKDHYEEDGVLGFGARAMKHTIVIDEKLLRYVESDDELAAILSHELAHVLLKDAHHGAPGFIGNTFFWMDTSSYMLMDVLSQCAMRTGQAMLRLVNRRYVSKLPTLQQREMRADALGLRLMHEAGYQPDAMTSILHKIVSKDVPLWKTHPVGEQRIHSVRRMVKELTDSDDRRAEVEMPTI